LDGEIPNPISLSIAKGFFVEECMSDNVGRLARDPGQIDIVEAISGPTVIERFEDIVGLSRRRISLTTDKGEIKRSGSAGCHSMNCLEEIADPERRPKRGTYRPTGC